MSVTTAEVFSVLSNSSLPSVPILSSVDITGFESNIFVKDLSMFIASLYLVNEVIYEGVKVELLPKPKPYRVTLSRKFDSVVFAAKLDLELENFNLITNYQRDSKQPYNGLTAEPLNLVEHQDLLSFLLSECGWLLINFVYVSPMQFLLDITKACASISGKDSPINLSFSNQTTAMTANIKIDANLENKQIPNYNEIIF